MNSILSIISGTPTWAWLLLCYLVYIGFAATKARVVWIPRLFIIPAVLTFMKSREVFAGNIEAPVAYLLCGIIGCLIGFNHATNGQYEIIKHEAAVKLKGSWLTLIVLICFFLVRYTFSFLNSEMLDIACKYRYLDIGLSALFSWYFLGRALFYLVKLRN